MQYHCGGWDGHELISMIKPVPFEFGNQLSGIKLYTEQGQTKVIQYVLAGIFECSLPLPL